MGLQAPELMLSSRPQRTLPSPSHGCFFLSLFLLISEVEEGRGIER